MRAVGVALIWLGATWCFVVVGFVLVCCIAHIMLGDGGTWANINDVLMWFSPFNILNYAMVVILVMPGGLAHLLGKRLRCKAERDAYARALELETEGGHE